MSTIDTGCPRGGTVAGDGGYRPSLVLGWQLQSIVVEVVEGGGGGWLWRVAVEGGFVRHLSWAAELGS